MPSHAHSAPPQHPHISTARPDKQGDARYGHWVIKSRWGFSMLVKYCVRGTVALGVIGALVWCETHGEGQEHAQYAAPSTLNVNAGASGLFFSNVSNSTVTVTYHPAPLNLEQLIPHGRLVIQTSALTPPVQWKIAGPATGADPFFQRRQSPQLKVAIGKLPPFWCASYQKFRARRA